MLSNNSDYAVNKTDPEAIVCRSVTGENVRLTREHFDSDEEFQKCKAWSDEDYRNSALRERALNDRRYSFELDHLLDRHEYSDWLSAELKGSEKLKNGRDYFHNTINNTINTYRHAVPKIVAEICLRI